MEQLPINMTENNIENEMLEYATSTYGGTYKILFYEEALDYTRSHILCLEDNDGYIFNIYKSEESGEIVDDYANSIVDRKFYDHFNSKISLNDEYKLGVIAVMNPIDDVDVLKDMTMEECRKSTKLYSLIFALQINGNSGDIQKHSDAIVSIYKELKALNVSTIDFNVVITNGDDERMNNTMLNMRYGYTGSWYAYENVVEYIASPNPKIDDSDDVEALIEVA